MAARRDGTSEVGTNLGEEPEEEERQQLPAVESGAEPPPPPRRRGRSRPGGGGGGAARTGKRKRCCCGHAPCRPPETLQLRAAVSTKASEAGRRGGAVSARLLWPPVVVCVLAGLDVGCRVLDRLDCSALGG
jgi:hypothetical protein